MKSTIIIPTYNESDNIEKLVSSIMELNESFFITIVDDNSPDGTGEIADRLSRKYSSVQVLHRPKKAGLGTAYIEGFLKALNDGADIIFEMDADFSHDPHSLKDFIEAIKNADLVIGSRYKDGVRVLGWRFRRLFLSKMANIFVSHTLVNPKIDDYTSGFRCYRRKALEAIDLDKVESDGYAFQIEMTHLVHKKGFKIVEIPIIFREREKGYSKISRSVVKEAFSLTLKYRASIYEIVKLFFQTWRKYLYLDN
jgi:dolichol-phosphate mannosyltransferase